MKRVFCCVALLLLSLRMAPPAAAAVVTVLNNGPAANRVNIVFLGDGYTAGQIESTYVTHINAMLNHMFNQGEDPFVRYQKFFNAYRVNVVSNESGADVPPLGIYRDTALDASYYWDGSTERLLYVNESKANTALSNALAGTGITAGMKLVTVNDTRYGGGGGSYAVYAGGHPSAPEVALHELGHSFSNLADEYYYTGATYTGGEPGEVNVTKYSTGEKWTRWLGYTDLAHPGIGAVGAYQGARYCEYGLYRPTVTSKMYALGQPFNAVCREKIILDIFARVDPLDAYLNNSSTLVDPGSLWVDTVDPNVIKLEWKVNGQVVSGAIGETFSLASYGPGTYTVTARAYDDTAWVRINTNLLQQSVTWSVLISVPEPHTLILILGAGSGLLVLTWRRRRQHN